MIHDRTLRHPLIHIANLLIPPSKNKDWLLLSSSHMLTSKFQKRKKKYSSFLFSDFSIFKIPILDIHLATVDAY